MKLKLLPLSAQVAFFIALALALAGSIPNAWARQRSLVYINGNVSATGQNVVIALTNDGAGSLSPVPGSPFATGGTGGAGAGGLRAGGQWDWE